MNIAFLTNVLSDREGAGDSVHVSQIANGLLEKKHKLFTNLLNESNQFVKLDKKGFIQHGRDIDIFYIRICGNPQNDLLTLYKYANYNASCIWEINSPLEELKTIGKTEKEIRKLNRRRRKLAKMVDYAICVSEEMEEYAKNNLNIHKACIIPNGSDLNLFKPSQQDKEIININKFKVLWVGSTQYKWQGINIVKEIAEKIYKLEKDVLFLLTANGTDKDNIKYLGKVDYSKMPGIMGSVQLGLCLYEPIQFYKKFYFSPLKLFDFMAMAVPVIGNNSGQIRTIIEENANGLLTDANVDDILNKIIFLKNNRNITKEMGERGRRAIIEKYNWSKIVDKTEKIFKSAIEEHIRKENNMMRLVNKIKWPYIFIKKLLWALK